MAGAPPRPAQVIPQTTEAAGPAGRADRDPVRPPAARLRADRCPGALVLHEAADGGLARIRLPGGLIDAAALAALAVLAESFGEHGAVELTSRGNLQLRGVPADRRAELADRVADLGLLPSATHERVRNIVASPFAGLTSSAHGLDEQVRALDEALRADPGLARLSGRFLFGLDDGTGDIAALAPDAWAEPAAAERWWVGPAGVEVSGPQVAGELLAAARAFLRAAEAAATGEAVTSAAADAVAVAGAVTETDIVGAASTSASAAVRAGAGPGRSFWRIRELPDRGAALASGLRAGRPASPRPPLRSPTLPVVERIGSWRRPDGRHAAAVHVPLGRLTRAAADLLAAVSGALAPAGREDGRPDRWPLRITPWRSVVVPCLTDPLLLAAGAAAVGLVTDPASTWTRVTACAGRPGCASALADVRADAARAVAAGRVVPAGSAPVDAPPVRAHWSGCARRCGRPAGPHVEVVASVAGYLVRDAGAEPKESRW